MLDLDVGQEFPTFGLPVVKFGLYLTIAVQTAKLLLLMDCFKPIPIDLQAKIQILTLFQVFYDVMMSTVEMISCLIN